MRDNISPFVSARPARDDDKPAIWQLYEEALRQHIETIWGWDADWQQAYFEQAFLAMSTRVVELDGRVAGYLQIDREADEDYLSMLILDPAARSCGVGARLLSAILAESKARGRGLYLRVFRTNTAARRFYEREGWALVADEGNFLVMRPGARAPS
jgi:ribosomal protein S18 acetylase RimI-like enzyme